MRYFGRVKPLTVSVVALVAIAAFALGPTWAAPPVSTGGILIGGFDVGPGGHPQARPFDQTAGNTWLIKVWSPLVSLNEDSTGLAPQLATSWRANPTGTRWVFKLRPNVKWHDGKPFGADDVKFTFELALNPAFGWRRDPGLARIVVGAADYSAGRAPQIRGIRAVDRLTVEFSLTESDARFPYKLVEAYMLPAHVLKGQDPARLAKSDWFLAQAVGTGPWKISRYVRDQFQDLVPNGAYWNGKPRLAHLINRYFADETTAILALERGEIHFTFVSSDVAVRLKADPKYKVFEGSSFVTNYIIFNLRDRRLQDVRVRQAFLYAIDRRAIVKQVFGDTAYLTPCTLPGKKFWPSDVNAYDYNPDRARQLLREAGWNPGDPFEMWTYYGAQVQKDAVQAIQQYLSQVGVRFTPVFMDVPAYNARFYTGEGWPLSYRGIGLVFGQTPRTFLLPSTQTKDGKSWGGLDDPRLSQLVEASERALTDDGYTRGMQDVCRYLNQNVIEAPLWVGLRYGAASVKVRNFYWFPAPAGGPYEDHSELWEKAP